MPIYEQSSCWISSCKSLRNFKLNQQMESLCAKFPRVSRKPFVLKSVSGAVGFAFMKIATLIRSLICDQ